MSVDIIGLKEKKCPFITAIPGRDQLGNIGLAMSPCLKEECCLYVLDIEITAVGEINRSGCGILKDLIKK